MIGPLIALGVLLGLVLLVARRRKAARSVAVDGAASALASLAPSTTIGRHRAPAARRWFAGSGGAM
jgi:hypothetical protein